MRSSKPLLAAILLSLVFSAHADTRGRNRNPVKSRNHKKRSAHQRKLHRATLKKSAPADVSNGGAVAESTAAKIVRYIAYGSELAEAFRPVISLVTFQALYGITFTYILGIIYNQGRLAAKNPGTGATHVAREVIHEALFQFIANLLLPTRLVHLIVHSSAEFLFEEMGGLAAKWGPTAAGLAVIPFLPLLDPVLEFFLGGLFKAMWPETKAKAA